VRRSSRQHQIRESWNPETLQIQPESTGSIRRLSRVLLLALIGLLVLSGETAPGLVRPDPAVAATHHSDFSVGVAALPSRGCRAPVVSPGLSDVSLELAGETGHFYREVPTSYTGRTPVPVVLDFHGYSEPATVQVTLSQLGALGQSQGFITITPEVSHPGLTGAGPLFDTTPGGRDLRWVGGLIDTVENTLCVDQRRVFATGYSNGAFLVSAMACQYAGRVAAVAPVAGIEVAPRCRPSRPVPVVAFHGSADPLVAFRGGVGRAASSFLTPAVARAMGSFLPRSLSRGGHSIPGNAAAWAQRNGCAPKPAQVQVTSDVRLVRYRCPHDATVELYVVQGGGHTWPGSKFSQQLSGDLGRTTLSISADRLMWAFFRAHPLTSRD
jgi:polyhydroxybutyrate depolymerase